MNTFENKYVSAWIEDDILFGIYKKHAIITLDAAKETVKDRLQWQNGKTYKSVLFADYIQVMTPGARKYLSELEGMEKLAIIVKSNFLITLANIFINIDKPKRPTKLFTTREDAVKWLKEG